MLVFHLSKFYRKFRVRKLMLNKKPPYPHLETTQVQNAWGQIVAVSSFSAFSEISAKFQQKKPSQLGLTKINSLRYKRKYYCSEQVPPMSRFMMLETNNFSLELFDKSFSLKRNLRRQLPVPERGTRYLKRTTNLVKMATTPIYWSKKKVSKKSFQGVVTKFWARCGCYSSTKRA